MKEQREALAALLDVVERSCERALIPCVKVILTKSCAEEWLGFVNKCKPLLSDPDEVGIYFSPTYGWCIESLISGEEIVSGLVSLDEAVCYAKAQYCKIVSVNT